MRRPFSSACHADRLDLLNQGWDRTEGEVKGERRMEREGEGGRQRKGRREEEEESDGGRF